MSRRRFRVYVGGHVNAGKTSFVRTLGARKDWGQVHDLPGSSAAPAELAPEGGDLRDLSFVDGPGLQDPTGAWSLYEGLGPLEPGTLWQRFRYHRHARERYAVELAHMEAARDADLVLHLIDARARPSPRHQAGLALSAAARRPMVVVFNHAAGVPAPWRDAVAGWGGWPLLALDAGQPGPDGIPQFLERLAGFFPDMEALRVHAQARRRHEEVEARALLLSLMRSIAGWASRRLTVDDSRLSQDGKAIAPATQFKTEVWREFDERLHRWARDGDHAVDARWPEVAGRVGAAPDPKVLLGLPLDDSPSGLASGAGRKVSLKQGAEHEVSAGWSGRSTLHWMTGRQDLFISDAVLLKALSWGVGLAVQLRARGHGACGPLQFQSRSLLSSVTLQERLAPLFKEARLCPEWAAPDTDPAPKSFAKRDELISALLPDLWQQVQLAR